MAWPPYAVAALLEAPKAGVEPRRHELDLFLETASIGDPCYDRTSRFGASEKAIIQQG